MVGARVAKSLNIRVACQSATLWRDTAMQVVYERCCGLDIHKRTVVACVITPQVQETRTLSTMTKGLLELADWLTTHRVTHVAMGSTGVYWKPVHNLLEDDFTLLVVNAQHIKVACRSPEAWTAAQQFHTRPSPARTARTGAPSTEPDPATFPGD